MLNLLRKKKIQKRILIVLAVLIIPAFVLWGTGDRGKKRIAGTSFVGTIGKKKITLDDFFKAKKGIQIQLILSYLGQRDVLDKILKDRPLMNSLTWDRLVIIEAAREGTIEVSDKEVVDYITSHPLFLRDGNFDEKFYNYVIEQNLGINTRKFEEYLRDSLKINKVKENILKNVSVTDDEILNAYKRDHEKGKITYVSLYKEDLESAVEVTDSDIDDYYNLRREKFTTPDKINLEYIKFTYENMSERQLLMRAVGGIYKKIKRNPEQFNKIADENNRLVEETGLFFKGDPPLGFNFDKEIYDKIFNMALNSIDFLQEEAISGDLYIVRVKEKSPAKIKTKEEMASFIKTEIKKEKSEILAEDKANGLYKRISEDNLSLEEVSTLYGWETLETPFITRFDYLRGVGEAVQILDVIFESRSFTASKPFKTRKGYIIVRLDAFQEIDNDQFENDKEVYVNKVLAIKKERALKDWFVKVSKNAHLVINLTHL